LDEQNANDILSDCKSQGFYIRTEQCAVEAIRLCQTGPNRLGSRQMHLTTFRFRGDVISPPGMFESDDSTEEELSPVTPAVKESSENDPPPMSVVEDESEQPEDVQLIGRAVESVSERLEQFTISPSDGDGSENSGSNTAVETIDPRDRVPVELFTGPGESSPAETHSRDDDHSTGETEDSKEKIVVEVKVEGHVDSLRAPNARMADPVPVNDLGVEEREGMAECKKEDGHDPETAEKSSVTLQTAQEEQDKKTSAPNESKKSATGHTGTGNSEERVVQFFLLDTVKLVHWKMSFQQFLGKPFLGKPFLRFGLKL
jgi:hypothetical protein